MSFPPFSHLPPWAMAFSLVAHLAARIGLGVIYFRTLWWNTRLLVEVRRPTMAIALMAGRFVLLGCLLVLTSLEGALPLLVLTLGVLGARFAVLRRLLGAAP